MEMWEFLSCINDIHLIIKKFADAFPFEFEKTSIRPCGHCNGTGLVPGDFQKACERCKGIGFVGFKTYKDKTVCPDCNSTGINFLGMNVKKCSRCGGRGALDWVDAIKLGVEDETIL
jgi:DnaJ-class molecular chaperone